MTDPTYRQTRLHAASAAVLAVALSSAFGLVKATENRAAPSASARPIPPAPMTRSVPPAPSAEKSDRSARCPADMVKVRSYCVDRWEASMVDKDSGERLSPYYPPQPRLLREVWQAWELDAPLFGG